MPTIGSGLASMGDSIAGAMYDYHRKHVAYDQADAIARMVSQFGVDEQGKLTRLNDDMGKPKKDVAPLVDSEAYDRFRTNIGSKREAAAEAMNAISRIGLGTMAIAQREQVQKQIEESGLSGDYKRAATQHLLSESQPFTPTATSVAVPGVGNVPVVMTSKGQGQVIGGKQKGDPHVAAADALNKITGALNPHLLPGHFSDMEAWGNTPGRAGFKTLAIDKDGNPIPPSEWKLKRGKFMGIGGGEYENDKIANRITLDEHTVNNLATLQKKAIPSDTIESEQQPDMVRVQAPNGQTGMIPRGKLDAAIKAGYKEL